jgi:hypothetical protein
VAVYFQNTTKPKSSHAAIKMRIQNASLASIWRRALIERTHGVMANASKNAIQYFQELILLLLPVRCAHENLKQ